MPVSREEAVKKKSPLPDDVYIGHRLRLARLTRNISQSVLGEKMGITFQQIQKYEKGTNRLSGSRLKMAADALGVTPAYFFEGMSVEAAGDAAILAGQIDTLDMKIMTRLSRIKSTKARRVVLALISFLLGEEEGEQDEEQAPYSLK